jgi:hypothetical protein
MRGLKLQIGGKMEQNWQDEVIKRGAHSLAMGAYQAARKIFPFK